MRQAPAVPNGICLSRTVLIHKFSNTSPFPSWVLGNKSTCASSCAHPSVSPSSVDFSSTAAFARWHTPEWFRAGATVRLPGFKFFCSHPHQLCGFRLGFLPLLQNTEAYAHLTGLLWDHFCKTPCWRPDFDPGVGKIPWRRQWQPTRVFLPGELHGQRSLVGYNPWGCKESDTTSN